MEMEKTRKTDTDLTSLRWGLTSKLFVKPKR